jgi:hypothetical protein
MSVWCLFRESLETLDYMEDLEYMDIQDHVVQQGSMEPKEIEVKWGTKAQEEGRG